MLEQILRRQRQLQAEYAEKFMTALKEKLVTIGVQVPADLHQRMTTFLAENKSKPGMPKSLKELALFCIKHTLDTLTGPAKVVAADVPLASDAEQLRHCINQEANPPSSFEVTLAPDNALIVRVPDSALIAPGTIPDNFNGHQVRVISTAPHL